jgi:enhancing lycopene biosynthesis protein 2
MQDGIGIHLKPIGVGDSAEMQKAVLTAESRRQHVFLIFIPEIVMREDVVSHAVGAGIPLRR